MKVAFVYPDYAPTAAAGEAPYGFYSEGISSVAAILQEAGVNVTLLHLLGPPSREEFAERLKAAAPDLVGFHARTTAWPEVRRLAAVAKETLKNTLVVVGGYHATLAPDECAQAPEVDIVVVGEGEYPTLELCDALLRGRDFRSIANLWVRDGNGGWRRNPTRPLIEDLDVLPLPSYNIYDARRLYDIAIDTGPVMLSRGCPYQCAYCCNHQLKRAYPNPKRYARFRSPQRSISYIANLLAHFPNVKYLNITDNILPLDREWFFEFIDLYKNNIGLPFVCRHRYNLVQEDVIWALKEAGCYLIHFGLESGNEEIRRRVINRQMSNEQIIRAHEICRAAGIATLTYNMVGLPHEDKAKFLDTIKLNARVRPNRIVLSVFYPYPHTDLHDLSAREHLLAPVFDYESESYLAQPQFPMEQVRFCQAFFVPAIRYYQLLGRLGAPGRLLGRFSDAVFKSRLLPHRPLTALAGATRRLYETAKLTLRRRAPKVYLWLRDRRVRRA